MPLAIQRSTVRKKHPYPIPFSSSSVVALICVRFVLARVAWRYLPSRRRSARANRLPVFYSTRYFRRRTPTSRRLAQPDMDGKHVVWPLRESVRRLACLRCRLASRSRPSSNQMEAFLVLCCWLLAPFRSPWYIHPGTHRKYPTLYCQE